MSKKQETIADIIADMRKRCFPYAKSEDSGARYVAYLGYQEFPDRIEAAWEREKAEIAADNPNKVFKPRPKRTGLQQLKFAFMERKVSHG